ncbi:MAG: PAS domain S-box protein, partial [Mesorhizobium sp.]
MNKLTQANIIALKNPEMSGKDIQDFDYQDFFENGAIALHLVNADGIILHANKAELDLLGYPAEQYVGRHIAEFYPDRDAIEDTLTRLASGEKIERYPARLRTSDGTIKHVELTSSGNFRNGKLINTRCFTVDVS